MLSVKNSASHGHDSRVIVDRGVYEHETMSMFTAPTWMDSENLKNN